MNFNQGDLVLLPYPFSDQEGTKVRPGIIVSNETFNRKSQDFIMVPLTTVLRDEPFSFIINQENLKSGKLLRPSRIRIDKIFTVNKKLVITGIGTVSEVTLRKIKIEMEKLF